MTKSVITIARQLGAGGGEVAEKVAGLLGIPFYDKDLIALAAKESGLSEALFEEIEEKPTNSFLYSLVMGLKSEGSPYYRYGDLFYSDNLFRIQSQIIRNLADNGSCVLIDRCSDYILREHENVLTVFIHAGEEWRTERVMKSHHLKEQAALDLITKTDKRRSSFYNFHTNMIWENISNYDLSLDTSKIGIDGAAEMIVAYTKIRDRI